MTTAKKKAPAKKKAVAKKKTAARKKTTARKPAAKAKRSSPKPAIRTAPKGDPFYAAEHALRDYALGMPQASEDYPWGHRAFRVAKKVFLFLAWDEGVFTATTKLPHSQAIALMQTFAEPTGYGMGASGWVTAKFSGRDPVPVEVLLRWVDESYRAIAPKKLAALLTPSAAG